MNDSSNDIKKQFDDKIKSIEENDKKKTFFIYTIMNVSFVILFLAVLSGTIISYMNYKQVTQSTVNIKNNSNVVEFKKVN